MTTLHPFRLLVLPVLFLLLGLLPASAGDAYGHGRLTIKEVEERKNGDVGITFRAMAETMYWCPGADARVTPQGIELSFVRAGFRKRPKVDYPAKHVEPGGDQILMVPAGGKPVFVRDGNRLVKLEDWVDRK